MSCHPHSTVANPVAKVHQLYESRGGVVSRLEFIALCEREGINRNTAATQYNVCLRRTQKAGHH